MKADLLCILWVIGMAAISAYALPERIELIDGRVLENVTEAGVEGGKVKVKHSAGVSRHAISSLTPASLTALGIETKSSSPSPAVNLTRLETTDGKVYEELRSLRIKPSFISFVHKTGASSVRFDKLPEAIRTQCGYNPEVAKIFDRERAAQEKAIAEAEAAYEKKRNDAIASAEDRKRRQQAIWELECTTYGSLDYWSSSPRLRALQDAMAARRLRDSGYSDYDAARVMQRMKFR